LSHGIQTFVAMGILLFSIHLMSIANILQRIVVPVTGGLLALYPKTTLHAEAPEEPSVRF
jgi:hypothetical protein